VKTHPPAPHLSFIQPAGLFSRLAGRDRRFWSTVRDMHLVSSRDAQKKTGSLIFHTTDFEERIVTLHDLLFVYPHGEIHPNRILGFCAARRIVLSPPLPNVVKSGSIGYRDAKYVSAIISGANRSFLGPNDIKISGIHKNNFALRIILEKLGYKGIDDEVALKAVLAAISQSGLKTVVLSDGKATYISEKGDCKCLFAYDPHKLLNALTGKHTIAI
jgi:hypothetical protein